MWTHLFLAFIQFIFYFFHILYNVTINCWFTKVLNTQQAHLCFAFCSHTVQKMYRTVTSNPRNVSNPAIRYTPIYWVFPFNATPTFYYVISQKRNVEFFNSLSQWPPFIILQFVNRLSSKINFLKRSAVCIYCSI